MTRFVERVSIPLPTHDMDNNPRFEWSQTEVAEYLALHRVTFLRMEQRGVVPLARWRRLPQPHRIYDAREIEEVRKIVEAIHAAKKPALAKFVDEPAE